MADIAIRALRDSRELDQAVALQRVHWGDDAHNLTPLHMLRSIARHGGHVLGAYAGDELVGIVIGMLGADTDIGADQPRPAMANLLVFSKRMVVLPGYRGRNVGFRLKMAQRDLAVKQAIRLVCWTVDPLLAANAHLNIRKLGAVSQRYCRNYFGAPDEASLHSDRLFIDWWVTQRRVQQRAKGAGATLTLRQYFDVRAPIVNRARPAGAWMEPGHMTDPPGSSFALVEIPRDIRALEAADPDLGLAWRAHIREVFSRIFEAGYIITDFVSGDFEGRLRAFYLLSRHFDQEERRN